LKEEWLKNIKIEDLREPYTEIAEVIGVENTLKLVKILGGSERYFPKLDGLLKEKRDEAIREDFNGYNYRELARKYGLSERQIREICSSEVKKKRNQQVVNQINIFEIFP